MTSVSRCCPPASAASRRHRRTAPYTRRVRADCPCAAQGSAAGSASDRATAAAHRRGEHIGENVAEIAQHQALESVCRDNPAVRHFQIEQRQRAKDGQQAVGEAAVAKAAPRALRSSSAVGQETTLGDRCPAAGRSIPPRAQYATSRPAPAPALTLRFGKYCAGD